MKSIDAKREQESQLRALAEKITASAESGNAAAGGQTPDKVGVNAAKLADMAREINKDIADLQDICEQVTALIGSVENENERLVLFYRYINGWTWEKIADRLGYTYQHTCRLHGYALQKISLFLKNF